MVCGALEGTAVPISPDAMDDAEQAAQPEGTWYRAMIRADRRSVPGWLLRPMTKSQDAFRER